MTWEGTLVPLGIGWIPTGNGTCSDDSVACYLFADEEHRICFLNFDTFQLFCWDLLIFYYMVQ